jgi:hypothetical protein
LAIGSKFACASDLPTVRYDITEFDNSIREPFTEREFIDISKCATYWNGNHSRTIDERVISCHCYRLGRKYPLRYSPS